MLAIGQRDHTHSTSTTDGEQDTGRDPEVDKFVVLLEDKACSGTGRILCLDQEAFEAQLGKIYSYKEQSSQQGDSITYLAFRAEDFACMMCLGGSGKPLRGFSRDSKHGALDLI